METLRQTLLLLHLFSVIGLQSNDQESFMLIQEMIHRGAEEFGGKLEAEKEGVEGVQLSASSHTAKK